MLSYQHGYHAGNFADVIKHLTQTRILDYMIKKDKPLFYLETHAGRGQYDLSDPYAKKTGEALDGVYRLWPERAHLPAVFEPWISTVQAINTANELRFYPGSPWFAMHLLRSQDRLVGCERHPTEFSVLEQVVQQSRAMLVRPIDGLQAMQALLPPPERRGCIFIDPSYEIKTEYRDVPLAIKAAVKRFATGVYCLWYPLIDLTWHRQLVRHMRAIDTVPQLQIEYRFQATKGMWGCGLWILNPPYPLEKEMNIILGHLQKCFHFKDGSFLINSF